MRGTPQNRKRLWLRAVRSDSIQASRQLSLFGNDELLPICIHRKRVSWWDAIAPIVESLQEVELANYQLKRFEDWLSRHTKPELCLVGKEKNQVVLCSVRRQKADNGKPSFALTKSIHKDLPVLLKRTGVRLDSSFLLTKEHPSFTVRSLNGRTDQLDILLQDYTVRRLTPEALWILQMFGCDRPYYWKPGTSNTLKCKAIGNGVAYLNAREVLGSFFG